MFIYEKNGKLNMQFGDNKFPNNVPTMQISRKEIRLGSTIIPESGDIATKEVVMSDEYFDTISGAIEVAGEGAVITLLGNIKSNIVIDNDVNVVIDLNGHKIENDGDSHTITNKGTLGIKDSVGTGMVDNTVHGKAAVFNEQGATTILYAGTFNRSKESGKSPSESGGNSYYTIINQGVMTIKENVTVLQNGGSFSSLIENGWYDGSQNTSKINAVMIIEGGKFENGLNTLKNDDFGVMTIFGGKFVNSKNGTVVLNWNKLNVLGGEFIATGTTSSVLAIGYGNDEYDMGICSISGNTTLKANNETKNVFGAGSGTKNGGKLTIGENATIIGNISSDLPYEIIDLR